MAEEEGKDQLNEESRTFEELGVCEPLVNACKKRGWLNPTRIQIESIPHALGGDFSSKLNLMTWWLLVLV